jgi:hypothetical protein
MSDLLLDLAKASDTWVGHIEFAQWIGSRWAAPNIMDLGVDYGLSTFAFALSNKSAEVIGIDCFEGDEQSGFRDTEKFVNAIKEEHGVENIKFIKSYFDDIAPHITPKSVDILHIDGLHTYEAVKHDFNTWLPKVAPRGVILMHDTRAYKPRFGVGKFFYEIDMPKLNFKDSYGLGVVSTSAILIEKIYDKFSDKIDYVYFPGKR